MRGTKSCSAASLAAARQNWHPEPFPSSSVLHLSVLARRPRRGRWIEVVEVDRNSWRVKAGVRERRMAEHIASDRMTDEGITDFPWRSNSGSLSARPRWTPGQSRSAGRGQNQGAGNTLRFNGIFHSVCQNNSDKSSRCKAVIPFSFPSFSLFVGLRFFGQ